MPGDTYTPAELMKMTDAELAEARTNEFKRPARDGSIVVGNSVPAPQPQPDSGVWARQRAEGGSDFTCPSGQTCRLRRLTPEVLLAEGILDKVTRLEGMAQSLVDTAEGAPPQRQRMPTADEFRDLLETINVIIPLAVVEPHVYNDDDPEAPVDAIRVSDIDLDDRIAIMEKALGSLGKMDRFRHA